jgi:glucan phosphoethanolaminetransferase (alkaline phosphatase superfamily)
MWAVEALKEWHDFYVLVGTAGATLLGLLFVAVSLGANSLTEERQSATRTFMSPVVVHFTSVFFLSAVALFPWHQAKIFAALIGVTALIGAVISTYITVQVVRTDMTNYVEDYLAYGLLPGLGYVALLAAAESIYLEKYFGLDALAGALLLLAIVNIRNAWDLMLTMVRRSRRAD